MVKKGEKRLPSPSLTGWAVRQVVLHDIRHSLEVVVATVAEMNGPEAEENGDGATEVTLVFEEV